MWYLIGLMIIVVLRHLRGRHGRRHRLWHGSGHSWAPVLLRWCTVTVWWTAVASEAWRYSASALVTLLGSGVEVGWVSHRGVESPTVSSTTARTT